MKGHDAPGLDGDGLAGARVPARAWRLGTDLKVAEARNFYVSAFHQAARYQIEESVDHVLGFALVQADLLKRAQQRADDLEKQLLALEQRVNAMENNRG